jgi:hypothetical protein
MVPRVKSTDRFSSGGNTSCFYTSQGLESSPEALVSCISDRRD